MMLALRLARRGLGRVWPNPAVGCVIVRDGSVVGRGWTQTGGRPHAETEAIKRAREGARGAVAYVSLEPCAHHGGTRPCAEALIEAGVTRVVAAVSDPDPRVSGRGLRMLEIAGIAVESGVCAAQAKALNAGFFRRVETGRPLVTLKSALTLDGRIATAAGHSQWITGEEARRRSHILRADHDAILIGSNTALADDPMLTCRLPGLEERSPLRIVLDRRRRLHTRLALVKSADRVPTWVVTSDGPDTVWHADLRAAGCEVVALRGPDSDDTVVMRLLDLLAGRGITRLLVEGGSVLQAAFCQAGAADRLVLFRAPTVFGGDGLPAFAPFGVGSVSDALVFDRIGVEEVGQDVLETYRARN
jgi:diaminohydroxyphosphoribosylaminopyrimidine deaminase/5-amino-6-(5-phosphoribosylamino)uracil reductase